MTMRNLARISATGLLAAGVIAMAATPALAADVDFGLDLKGTTIALEAEGKPATATITNHGTTTPDAVNVLFDATDLDSSKVELDLGACKVEDGIGDCALSEDSIPGPGKTTETAVPLVLKEGASDDGPASLGKLTITLSVEGDTNQANDSKTVDVNLAGSGGDLRVLASDVTKVDAEDQLTGQPLDPGDTSWAFAYVANHGDRATRGIKLEIALPEDVTFAEEEGGCEYTADKRHATCAAEDYVLQPWDQDETGNKENSSGTIAFKVQLSEEATGPATLTGGNWTVSAFGLVPLNARLARTVPTVPDFVKPGCGDKEDEVEVDASDNSDAFAVLVAGPAGGNGGGEEEPGLPVTGPVAASIAGAGAAVLVLGVVLFVASRRRRVVLVTPGDER
jgi:hypothetical protein